MAYLTVLNPSEPGSDPIYSAPVAVGGQFKVDNQGVNNILVVTETPGRSPVSALALRPAEARAVATQLLAFANREEGVH